MLKGRPIPDTEFRMTAGGGTVRARCSTINIIAMSDFTTKNGTEERNTSGKTSCVFDWTPDEVVGNPGSNEADSEDHSSVILESDIIPDVKS